jgi:hypothetical protein
VTDTTEEKTNTPSAMTPERIAEIKARVEKATAGPWEAKPHDHTALGCMCIGCTDPVVGWFVDHPDAGYCSDLVAIRAGARELNDFGKPLSSCDAGPLLSYEDAEFAAEARRDVPDLLAEVERLANALAIKTEVAEGAQRVVESYAEQVERVSRDLAEAREDHAEVDRMRPVVEAATAWRALLAGPPEPYHRAQVRDLIAAIDAYGSDPMASSPDEHPEERCHRCGGPNVHAWCAPSPLWNQVMRGGDINNPDRFDGIVCTVCFAQLAEDEGIASFWRFYAERVHVELATTTPSGRVWNERKWLWEDVSDVHRPTGYLPIGSPNSEACQVCDEPWPCADAASPETIRRVAVVLSGEQPPAQPTTSED